MKIIKFILLFISCVFAHHLYGQRHYANISGIEFGYGQNIFGNNNTNLNLSISKYKSRTTYWKIGLNYFEKPFDFSYEEIYLDTPDTVSVNRTAKDYYIDAAYFKTVATNLSSLYFSLGIGAFAGVEGYKENKDQYDFIFGSKIEAEVEYFISGKIAVLGRVGQYWSPLSEINKWNTVWNIGLKILIY